MKYMLAFVLVLMSMPAWALTLTQTGVNVQVS